MSFGNGIGTFNGSCWLQFCCLHLESHLLVFNFDLFDFACNFFFLLFSLTKHLSNGWDLELCFHKFCFEVGISYGKSCLFLNFFLNRRLISSLSGDESQTGFFFQIARGEESIHGSDIICEEVLFKFALDSFKTQIGTWLLLTGENLFFSLTSSSFITSKFWVDRKWDTESSWLIPLNEYLCL